MRRLVVLIASALVLASATPVRADAPWAAKLHADLAEVDSQQRVRIGVYVRDLDSGESMSYRAGQTWYLASMVKVPVAIAVLRGMERGHWSLDSMVTLRASHYVDGAGSTNQSSPGIQLPVRFLLEQMMIWSDNTATDMLIELAGAAEVNAGLDAVLPEGGFKRIAGLGETRRLIYANLVPGADRLSGFDLLYLRSARSDRNRLQLLGLLTDTPVARFGLPTLDAAYDAFYATGINSGRLDAYGELLSRLVEGKLLTPPYTAYLLNLMERAATGAQRLKAGLPAGLRFAHKTGTQRRRVCDAGLARWREGTRERRVVVVACTRDEPSLERAEHALMQVGSAVCHSGLFAASGSSIDAMPCPPGAPARHGAPPPRR